MTKNTYNPYEIMMDKYDILLGLSYSTFNQS